MAALGLLPVLVLFLGSQTGETAYELYSIGNSCELAGNEEQAIEYYTKALALDPGATEICLTLANAYYKLRHYDDGIRWAEHALSQNGDRDRIYIAIGTGYIGKGDYRKALEAYQNASLSKPDDVELKAALATLYEVNGDPAKARQLLSDIPDEQKTADIFNQLAEIAGRQKDNAGAVDFYRLAYGVDSTDITALVGAGTGFDLLGIKDSSIFYYEKAVSRDTLLTVRKRLIDLYADTEQYEKLITAARSLLQIDPNETPARRNLGYALFKTGKTADALNEFLLASRLEPDDTYSRFYVARIYLEQGKYMEAKNEVLGALRYDSDFIELWVYLGFIAMDLKEYGLASDAFNEAAHRGGDLVQIYYLHGVIAEMQNMEIEAYFDYQRSLAIDPRTVPAREALANLCDRLGRKKEALTHFQRIIEIDSVNAIALNYVGYTYAERAESLVYALALIEKALSLEPDNGYYLDSRGWVYYRMRRYEAALADIERAAFLVEDAVILEHLGDVYFQLGTIDRAREAYQKALNDDPGNKILLRKLRRHE
jgi:tetratricopeptide (TPR) repeat protein